MSRLLLLLLLLIPAAADAATPPLAASLARSGCATLAGRVDALPGDGPLWLGSYDQAGDSPALAGAAFTYDNALAIIALVACDRDRQALRLGAALRLAATEDRDGAPGRLRNAYRAGAVPIGTPLPNGWWDKGRGQWLEDGYQLGSASGVVAWAGLALLTLEQRHPGAGFGAAAIGLGRWLAARCGADGCPGGIFGDGARAQALTWRSTEQNIDAEALFRWLARQRPDNGWPAAARGARAFIDSQWDAASGHFLIGTLPDGRSENRAGSGLDAQLWPLLLPDARPDWRRALDYADRAHGVAGGYAFNDDHAGLWSEGTAQAALAWRAVGRDDRAAALLAGLSSLISPGGYLWATPQARLSTGLAIGPDSTDADFFYYHLPHLGATAWAVLAALGWNPLTGRPL